MAMLASLGIRNVAGGAFLTTSLAANWSYIDGIVAR